MAVCNSTYHFLRFGVAAKYAWIFQILIFTHFSSINWVPINTSKWYWVFNRPNRENIGPQSHLFKKSPILLWKTGPYTSTLTSRHERTKRRTELKFGIFPLDYKAMRPPLVCSKTPGLKSSLFFLNFIILIKKLLHQQNTCFRLSKSFKKRITQFIQHACTTANNLRSLHSVHWKLMEMILTGNPPKKCYVKMTFHVMWLAELEQIDRSHRINMRRFSWMKLIIQSFVRNRMMSFWYTKMAIMPSRWIALCSLSKFDGPVWKISSFKKQSFLLHKWHHFW